MKKIMVYTFALLLFHPLYAQQANMTNPFPKTITVSGSAEMEIIPDQIFVTIELREYQKKNEPKKELEGIKTAFLESCRQSGIPDSSVSISSYTGFNNYYFYKKINRKDPSLMTGIIYQVIFSNSKQMDDLVDKLDDEATKSFQVVNTFHSRMTEFRKQLKIQAIRAAKDKGIYLTDAIGEKLGPAITIVEPDESGISLSRDNNNRLTNMSNGISQRIISYDNGGNDKTEVAFKKIKLRYEVNVVFSL